MAPTSCCTLNSGTILSPLHHSQPSAGNCIHHVTWPDPWVPVSATVPQNTPSLHPYTFVKWKEKTIWGGDTGRVKGGSVFSINVRGTPLTCLPTGGWLACPSLTTSPILPPPKSRVWMNAESQPLRAQRDPGMPMGTPAGMSQPYCMVFPRNLCSPDPVQVPQSPPDISTQPYHTQYSAICGDPECQGPSKG